VYELTCIIQVYTLSAQTSLRAVLTSIPHATLNSSKHHVRLQKAVQRENQNYSTPISAMSGKTSIYMTPKKPSDDLTQKQRDALALLNLQTGTTDNESCVQTEAFSMSTCSSS
jgi:hypothetical protein